MLAKNIVKIIIELIEGGCVPDRLTRLAMRQLCSRRLQWLDRGSACANRKQLQQFIAKARLSPVAPVPDKANEQHYEVPAQLYAFVLGRRLKYSSGYWPEGVASLDEAEEASLRESCDHAQLEDGMRVLELGCGWGSLSLWITEHYPNCQVTAVSNSNSQREFINQQAATRGCADRLNVLTADMNDFATSSSFDRVISIEMFEHMRNYEELLRRISSWLNDDGKLFVHIFCHRQFAYEFSDLGPDDWMGRHFFTGGIMPSDDLIPRLDEDMQVVQQWRWNGRHYQRTAEAWIANLDRHREQILPILAATYGERQARRWWMRWRMLFLAGAELFGYRNGQEWYVTHYLLAPQHGHHRADKRPSWRSHR